MRLSTASAILSAALSYYPSALSFAPNAPPPSATFVSRLPSPYSIHGGIGMSAAEVAEVDATEGRKETYQFQAEVGRVMDIIINSLYSDRDVFLRELVSNAADACDKRRFLSITSDSGGGSDSPAIAEPEIRIRSDEGDGAVMIEDSGVGMTRDELINNLGRIAQSGTRNFLDALGKGTADVNLIGQFGVGFYSAYLVADRVEVITKSMQPGSPQLRWESGAGQSFTIEEYDGPDPIDGCGTRIVLHLKDDSAQYLDPTKLEELLQRYSEFIEFPISVWKEKTEYKKVPDVEANKDLAEGEEPKMKTVPETTVGYELMNTQKPIWLRSPRDVTEDEYKDFYKSAFRASYDDPMRWSHFSLEGQVECKAVLYVPGMLPFELSRDMFDDDARNIRLYVKRVFINDKFEDLMPRWLKFVRGVVDSDDLPLNVGREILQKSKVLSIINRRLVRKSLDMIRDIADGEDDSDYIMFWNNFGKYLKVGAVEDERNREDIVPLLRFYSSSSGDEYTSLDGYAKNMKEGQKSIYYVTGDGRENAAMSPAIEKLTSRGYEVLYMIEPLDEICIESVREYEDFKVVDATKEGLKLDDADEELKEEEERLNERYSDLREYLEGALAGKVQRVKVSPLLTDSPAALVQGAYGMSPTMQRYMRAQSVAAGMGDGAVTGGGMNQAVMEINPNHPIVKDLDRMVKSDRDSEETMNFAVLMYDVAGMTSGYEVGDVKDFARRVMALMSVKARDDGAVRDAEVVEEERAKVESKEAEPEAKKAEVVED